MAIMRRLAVKILNVVVRLSSPGSKDWARAMLRELDFIEGDWTALFWALGCARIIFIRQDARLADLSGIPEAAQNLTKKIRRRTRAGYVATLIQIIAFGSLIFIFPNPVQRIGSALVVAVMFYITYQLYAARPGNKLIEEDTSSWLASFRRELERQRDFHNGVRLWSRLALFVPGPMLLCIGFSTAHPEIARLNYWIAAVTIIVLILAAPLNLREARNYQRQINELDALRRKPR